MTEAVAFVETFAPWGELRQAVAGGSTIDELLDVLREEAEEMIAEGASGPDTPAALARALEQFGTAEFRRYLAGRLGLM